VGMLIAQKIGQVTLVGCSDHWHNRHSCRKLVLHIPLRVAGVHLSVYLVTFRDCEAHLFEIEVHVKSEMCQKVRNTFENIPTV